MNFTVQYDDDNWNSFRASAWAQNSLLIPSSSFVSSGWNSSLSPWDSPLRFSLLSVDSRVRVGSGNSYSLPDIFAEPSATRNINYPSFLGVIKTSFAFSLSGYIFWCVSLFPILQSQQSEYILPKILTANKACPRRIHQIFVHFDISRLPGGLGHLADSNSITQNPTTAYHPIQIAKKTADVPSLIRRAARSAIPLISDRWSVVVGWFHDDASQYLPNSNELHIWITFGFCDGCRNVRKFFSVSCEVLVWHGFHWVARTCTTTACRWLFRDSRPSLRTLCSAVVKSPYFSVRTIDLFWFLRK